MNSKGPLDWPMRASSPQIHLIVFYFREVPLGYNPKPKKTFSIKLQNYTKGRERGSFKGFGKI